MPKPYTVVAFVEDDDEGSIEVVPTTWLKNPEWATKTAMCYWPPYKKKVDFNKAVDRQHKPDKEIWTLHRVEILAVAGEICKFVLRRVFN